MKLSDEMQSRGLTPCRRFLRSITDNPVIRLDDVFVAFGRFEHSEKAMSDLQKPDEDQVINAHKGSIA